MLSYSIRTLVMIVVLPTVLLLAGCGSSHPLGISEEQWQVMSTEDRLRAHERQAELDRASEERRVAEARMREEEAKQQQMALDARRRDARYGERLQCVLADAEAYLGGKWRPIEPLALDVVHGMTQELVLAEPVARTLRYRRHAHAAFDGQTLSICPNADDPQRQPAACMRLLGTFEQFRRGVEQHASASKFLRGRLRCDLAPGEGMPPRIIIGR